VRPEILDRLPADHPDAARSRRDLRRINFLMGNERWILRQAARFPDAARRGVVELGAGDGRLVRTLARRFPDAPVRAYDLSPRPAGLAPHVEWTQGDLFECAPPDHGGILIANLFLHHFEGDGLKRLGDWCAAFDVLLFREPDRRASAHLLGRLLHPFVNHVTRHDMHVSIDAGFGPGELPQALGLDAESWHIDESHAPFGARQWLMTRRADSTLADKRYCQTRESRLNPPR
jgi:hypothetical protein